MKKILYLLAFLVACSMTSHAQLKVDASGSVGVGTSTPGLKLEVLGQVLITNDDSYPAAKQSTMLMRHYSDPAANFAYFKAQSSATQNSVNFGGGAGANYAATVVVFFTTPNTTDLNGTERMRIRGDGRIRISDNGGDPTTHDLTLHGTAAKTGGGDWSTISDRRVKTGIRDFDGGLAEVMQIRPVYFKYKKGIDRHDGAEYVGVIAQEMQKVAPYTVTEVELAYEEGETRNIEHDKILTYDGTAVRYMLVNAIQEQQEMIEEKDAQIAEIMNKLEELSAEVAALKSGDVDVTTNTIAELSDATLGQNAPNPFNESTVISYNVPETAVGKNVSINIMDMEGKLIKTVPVQETGKGQLNLKANTLQSGSYMYQLVVGNEVIDTKTMVLTK